MGADPGQQGVMEDLRQAGRGQQMTQSGPAGGSRGPDLGQWGCWAQSRLAGGSTDPMWASEDWWPQSGLVTGHYGPARAIGVPIQAAGPFLEPILPKENR